MSVNLLVHAPTQGTLFCLDDQPSTADGEKRAAAALNLKWQPTRRPRKFVELALDWAHRYQEISEEERAETRAALVIDNRMNNPTDIEEFIHERNELHEAEDNLPQNKQLINVDDGSRTGLIFIQYVLRPVTCFKQLPMMLLSAFDVRGYEETIRRLNNEYEAPTKYVSKMSSALKSPDRTLFTRTIGTWMYHRGLYIMHRLSDDLWDLSEGEVCGVLALRSGDVRQVANLFDRRRPRPTTDTDQRVDTLRIIHERLAALFNGRRDVELEWLATPVPELGGSRPRDLICSGDFQKLGLVQAYVDFISEPGVGHAARVAPGPGGGART
ncbi:hypothetical protein DF3PB_2690002 [uncultured Defluviicoccus sp.]|uniref:Antitoxin Xre/MbcA/ParS-like toxin-binding domain-containing protein n=1 Tax=metagenome TaxID=256318 RepID=A0A380TF86_9ZZZZ|nr:hypothetical protein DF3PB_2690002 [uncultured Defluviicoccus sp.]